MIIPEWLLKFGSHIYFHKYPMWLIYKPALHKVKGYEINQILKTIQIGDILFRLHKGYLSSMSIPGKWGHVALYVMDDYIIHSIGEGVKKEHILDFCRTDCIAVCRVKEKYFDRQNIWEVVENAEQFYIRQTPYDWDFNSKNDALYCSELVNVCYKNIFNSLYTEYLGTKSLQPDALYESEYLEKIITINH